MENPLLGAAQGKYQETLQLRRVSTKQVFQTPTKQESQASHSMTYCPLLLSLNSLKVGTPKEPGSGHPR